MNKFAGIKTKQQRPKEKCGIFAKAKKNYQD